MLRVLNSFLFAIIFMLLIATNAYAVIEVEEYMGDNFLPYQGYSTEMIRLVKINRAKTFAHPQPNYLPKSPIKRAFKKFANYIDPAADIGDFGNHNIITRTGPWDY